MAEILGIDESTYSKIERGEIDITWSRIRKLSDFYHVPTSQLTGESIGNILSDISNSPIAMQNSVQHITSDEKHLQLLAQLCSSIIDLQKTLLPVLEKIANKL